MRNIFRKNKVSNLTNEEKINASKAKSENALGMFTKIYKDLVEANQELNEVVIDDKAKVESLNRNITDAVKEMEANVELQEKLKPFIKGDIK